MATNESCCGQTESDAHQTDNQAGDNLACSSSASSASSSCGSTSSAAAAAVSCCGSAGAAASSNVHTSKKAPACCEADESGRPDYLFWTAFALVVVLYAAHFFTSSMQTSIGMMAHAVFELFNTMAIGLVIGVLMVAVLSKVPREFVVAILGSHTGLKGLVKATIAGLLLDLCSHGILMVGAKLYERGASTGQVMAFLIASPWNSLSLTIILIALIGFGWTLCFIVLSVVVAIITGWVFDTCVHRGMLPSNPHKTDLPENFNIKREAKAAIKNIQITRSSAWDFVVTGVKESKMVIKWLFIGIILAALIRAFVPEDYFASYFGPTFLGLLVTIFAATVIEVCSEGSTPIAADIFNRANAPGNGFAFLMTGVSTDYTEIMVLKDTTKSWKIALFLPLITVPQIVAMALVLNSV